MGFSSNEQSHLGDNPGSGVAFTGPNLVADQPYLFVAKIITHATANDEYFLKIFGGTPGDGLEDLVSLEPDTWDLTWNSKSMTGIADAIAISAGSHATARIDEIRLGTSWAAVTAVIPEPTAAVLLVTGALLLLPLSRRRGRRRLS